jgi:hypothetical protein
MDVPAPNKRCRVNCGGFRMCADLQTGCTSWTPGVLPTGCVLWKSGAPQPHDRSHFMERKLSSAFNFEVLHRCPPVISDYELQRLFLSLRCRGRMSHCEKRPELFRDRIKSRHIPHSDLKAEKPGQELRKGNLKSFTKREIDLRSVRIGILSTLHVMTLSLLE